MKKIRNFGCAFVMTLVGVANAGAADSIILEHTFNGYYMPYNFPGYSSSDDERYFYPMMITDAGTTISLVTYNEDYTVKEEFKVSYAVPSGYKVSQVMFSSSLKLGDGTPFFIVSFSSDDISDYGKQGYAIACAFNSNTGKEIFRFPSAGNSVTGGSYVYRINGKPSILMYFMSGTSWETRVYSLGAATSGELDEQAPAVAPEPIRVFDISGREVSRPEPGHIYVEQLSDGSSRTVAGH